MENHSTLSIKNIVVKWGIIDALFGIILIILADIMGLTGNSYFQWIGIPIFVVIVILAHKEYISGGEGHMSYVKGLSIGTLISALASFISSIFFFIYIKYINKVYIEMIKEKEIMKLENRELSDAQIEQSLEFMDFFMSPWLLTFYSFFFGIFIGFIISLIVTIFTKKI